SGWRRALPIGAAPFRLAPRPSDWRCALPIGAAPFRLAPRPSDWRRALPIGAAPFRLAPRPSDWRCAVPIGAANFAVSGRPDAASRSFHKELPPISLVTLLPGRIKGCLGGHRLADFQMTGGCPSAAVDCRGA